MGQGEQSSEMMSLRFINRLPKRFDFFFRNIFSFNHSSRYSVQPMCLEYRNNNDMHSVYTERKHNDLIMTSRIIIIRVLLCSIRVNIISIRRWLKSSRISIAFCKYITWNVFFSCGRNIYLYELLVHCVRRDLVCLNNKASSIWFLSKPNGDEIKRSCGIYSEGIATIRSIQYLTTA